MSNDLRSKVIRLAHQQPSLRLHLLPLLKEAAEEGLEDPSAQSRIASHSLSIGEDEAHKMLSGLQSMEAKLSDHIRRFLDIAHSANEAKKQGEVLFAENRAMIQSLLAQMRKRV